MKFVIFEGRVVAYGRVGGGWCIKMKTCISRFLRGVSVREMSPSGEYVHCIPVNASFGGINNFSLRQCILRAAIPKVEESFAVLFLAFFQANVNVLDCHSKAPL
jgi:hypothetical protein